MGRISLVDPRRAGGLAGSRVALHWAAQLASAAGTTLLEARSDFSHTSLEWSHVHHALLGAALNDGGLRAGLRPSDFSLLVLEHDEEVSSLPLPGQTLTDGLRWLGETLSLRGTDAKDLERPAHELPPHPVADGGTFARIDSNDLAQLVDWFAGSDAALGRVAAARDDASEVRCWPHHFDVATLITLEAAEDAEASRTVGAGMSPGDGSYEVPYLYVTPWPYPSDSAALPALPLGRWHTEGWTGAVLIGTDLPDAVEPAVAQFFDAAIAAAEQLTRP